MPRVSYVNGQYIPHTYASTHIEDRGYLFADGIYEVIAFINGHLADEKGHLDRLERSLKELSLRMPVSRASLRFILRELLRRNRLKNAAVYIQITRGVSKREFKHPDPEISPTLTLICWPFKYDHNPHLEHGIRAITTRDQRWARRDIKTIALLPQTMAKQAAAEQGAQEAWMIDDSGYVTEGASSNAWIYKDGTLFTRPATHDILKGVTRSAVERIAKEKNIPIIEQAFTPEDAYSAQEAFCTSATSLIMPVIQLNEHLIGGGKPGTLVHEIYAAYRNYADSNFEQQNSWTE